MTSTDLDLLHDHHYLDRLPNVAEQLARSSMCPDQYRGKPDDIAVVGMALAELGLRLSIVTLPQTYVVHSRPAFFAQLQIALAGRHGCHIVPLDEDSAEDVAVVKVLGKDQQWHRVTVTMADAVKAGWTKKNPNYASMPDRMLMARAVTKAIGQHCPEAKLLLPPADREALPLEADSYEPEEATGELTVPAGWAKTELVRRYEQSGLTHAQAISCAMLLWSSHGLKDKTGADPVPKSQVDALLSVFDQHPAPAEPSIGVVAPEATGGPPLDDDIEDGEIVGESLFDDDSRPVE